MYMQEKTVWKSVYTVTDDIVLLCARYDNLGKGASGAAIECMNIALGLDASTGLQLEVPDHFA